MICKHVLDVTTMATAIEQRVGRPANRSRWAGIAAAYSGPGVDGPDHQSEPH